MRVLGFCPTLRLEPETVASLLHFRLQVQMGEIPGISSFDILLTTDNPHLGGRANILHNYRKCREMALSYDRTLILESDVIPPPDALSKLSRLLDDRADAAYGLYCFRPKSRSGRLIVNVYARPKGGSKTMEPGTCPNTGSSLTLKGRYDEALRRGIVPCSGGGLGIVMVKREVMENVTFRDKGPRGAHCDTYWNRDVWRAGFQQWADMTVVCGHKTPEGHILWPPQTDTDMAYKAIRSFSGRGFTYSEGRVFDDPRGDEWVKAGLCEKVEDEEGNLSSMTKAELYDLASEKEISGRSSMSKAQLLKALS